MNSTMDKSKFKPISLRLKILVGFTVLFSGVFSLAFYWFYNFATEKTMNRLFLDMQNTAEGAAKRLEVDELLSLYKDGKLSADPTKLPSDPRYKQQLAIFRDIHGIEPRAWLYTFVLTQGDQERLKKGAILTGDRPPIATSQDVQALQPDQTLPSVFLADVWVYFNPSKAAKFLEVSRASQYTLEVYRQGKTVYRPLYNDGQFGSWMSTYIPLKNQVGETVAVLGVDFEADYVREVQQEIRDRVVVGFAITYTGLFVLVFVLSDLFTKPIVGLTKAAERIGEGEYTDDLDLFQQSKMPDEISTLAEVFALMVSKVKQREESLKQQVTELKIEIDEVKRKKQVSEIVDSDFFHDLQTKARRLRNRVPNAVDESEPEKTILNGNVEAANGHQE